MSTFILPPRFDKAAMARLFMKRRLENFFGLIKSRPVEQAPDGTPLSIELIWMPAYAFRFMVSRGAKRNSVWMYVDASFGSSALFQRINDLVEEEPGEEMFPPLLDADAAEQRAREGIIRFVLRKRGAKPAIESVEEHRLYYAPVYVYYMRMANGKMDFAIRDGYTGDPMGGHMRRTIINALIAKHKGPRI